MIGGGTHRLLLLFPVGRFGCSVTAEATDFVDAMSVTANEMIAIFKVKGVQIPKAVCLGLG